MQEVHFGSDYDLIIASRILHFARNAGDFRSVWEKVRASLKVGGLAYVAMNSAIASEFVVDQGDGIVEFMDGRKSCALTDQMYADMKQGMEEVEALQTIIYENQRCQSVLLLRKI